MGDTATQVVDNNDGTYLKRISAGVVEEDLVDALTNMMHVAAANGTEFEFAGGSDALENAWTSANNHFRAEQAGEDGVHIEVV